MQSGLVRVARRALAPLAWLAPALVAASVVTSSPASAAGEKDKDALALRKKALEDDYLALDTAAAEKKLREAIKLCGKDSCSPKVLAQVYVALGIIQGEGNKKWDQAKESFTAALKADPQAALDPDLTTPELTKTFKEAQKAVPEEKPPQGDKTPEKTPDKTPTEAGGDISHTPIPEQEVSTPVPVFIEIPEELGATKVTLRYKPFGVNKWKTVEMKPVGKGFGALVPCEDVTLAGDLKYYIVVKDENGDPVGTAGSLKEPYKIPIKNNLTGESPSLPGEEPPQKCAVKEDCPPGLPGCPENRGTKQEGDSCDEDLQCAEGLLCNAGVCAVDASKAKGPRNFVGLGLQFDMLLLNGVENVCAPESGPNYVCFHRDGEQFHGNPVPQDAGLSGGFALASTRALVHFDRQWIAGVPFTAGVRLGYAFGGSPSGSAPPNAKGYEVRDEAKSFLAIHGEVRAAYHFLGIFERAKVKPYAFFAAGLAQVNGSVPLTICDRADTSGKPIGSDGRKGNCPRDVDEDVGSVPRDVDAYQITGLNFAALGAGANFGITPTVGIYAELKLMAMLPTFGIVVAPSIGPVFGF